MNRLPLVAFAALVLMCTVIVAQTSSHEQQIASAPTGLALEITYLNDRPIPYVVEHRNTWLRAMAFSTFK